MKMMSPRRQSLVFPDRWTATERWVYALGVLMLAIVLRREIFPIDWPYAFLPYAVVVPVVYFLFGRWPGIAFLLASGLAALLTTTGHGEPTLRTLSGYLLYLLHGGIICWMIDRLQSTTRTKVEVLETQTDWLTQIDAEGRFEYLNPAAAEAYGFTGDDGVGKPWTSVVPQADVPAISGRLTTLSPANPVVISENRIRDAQGRVIWGHFVNRGRFDTQGNLTGILSVGRNITDRKQLEQQLADVAKDLEDLYQHAPCGYCSVDAEGRFIKVNETLCDWLGKSETDLIAHHMPMDFLTPQGVEKFRIDFPRFLQEGSTKNLEFELLRQDGTRRWVSVDSNAMHDKEGKYLHSRTVLIDITARKQAEAEAHRLREELEQRVQERTEESRRKTEELESFTYSLSHDLRAPIRSINSAASILLEEQDNLTPLELHEGLAKIRASSDRMAQLMDAMLALGALTSPVAPQLPFSHATLVQDALDNLLPPDSPRRAQILVHELPAGEGNARRVQRVWESLLSNALKFTAHTEQPRIEIGYDADSQSFYVRDNGVGFDMRYAEKILKPFERAHDSKLFEGAGIGLAIADKVVRRDGGRIWYESAPGQGAAFHFTLQGPEQGTTK